MLVLCHARPGPPTSTFCRVVRFQNLSVSESKSHPFQSVTPAPPSPPVFLYRLLLVVRIYRHFGMSVLLTSLTKLEACSRLRAQPNIPAHRIHLHITHSAVRASGLRLRV